MAEEDPESIEVRTHDGQALAAELREPFQRKILGTVVFAHPMFGNKSVFARPRGNGVAELFLKAGWRTLTFDFRGHGASKPRAPREHPWAYDDLVQVDLPTVVDAARARWPRARIALVGHSLGGQVVLAAQGAGLVAADAIIIAAGANVWMRHLEPSRRAWALKLAAMVGMDALTRRHGHFPTRALRLGSDDEAAPYVADLMRFAATGRWTSRDGNLDYEARLASIKRPTLVLTSEGDRLQCRPESARRMMSGVASCTHHVTVRSDDGGPPPRHGALVTDPGARRGWNHAVAWLSDVPPRA